MGVQALSDYYRFCPDQVDLLISDAVCMGRRRVSYPKCRGCQFNDDERQTGPAADRGSHRAAPGRLAMIDTVFKAYDVRATYPDPLDESVAWRIGNAAAVFFRNAATITDRADPARMSVVVGRDMRKSSPALMRALSAGLSAGGTPVINVGMIDTPQIYFAVNHFRAAGGIQTTASHNPAHYNGFKLCARGGAPIGQDTGLGEICRIAQKIPPPRELEQGQVKSSDLSDPYKAFVRGFLKPLRPLKVVSDASNGMAGQWVPLVFGDVLNLELIHLNLETTGEFVHEPNPLVDANLNQLRDEVRRTGADLGVCFDGDADRCMLVDENAEIVRCDMITALLAGPFLEEDPGSTIVYDLRSSRVVAEEIRKRGGRPRRQRVGHAFMKKALAETQGVFGGELSGHFYFKDNFYCDSGMLALVHVLNVLTRTGQSLSTLIRPLRRYSASGERNFENPDKDTTIDRLAGAYADAEIDHLDGITVQYDDWWFNVRKSNTEPLLRLNLEANSAELMNQKLEEVAAHLGRPVDH